jgi:hypothetical protein
MPKLIISADGGAMPAEGQISSILPRRGFLRGLVTLPLIGGGLSLIGAPSAVAEPVTPALLAAYRRWLQMEQYLLFEEMPEQPPARARLSLEGSQR